MSNHDPWNGLATLMTLLETVVDANKDYLVLGKDEGVYINLNINYALNIDADMIMHKKLPKHLLKCHKNANLS